MSPWGSSMNKHNHMKWQGMLHADRLLGACAELNHTIIPYQHRKVLDAIIALFTTIHVDLKNTVENERQMNSKGIPNDAM